MPGPLDAVKKALQAYVDKDRDAIEAVIGDPYSFTSPLDNALSRETYFERCWPNSESCTGMKFLQGAEVGDWAFIVYEGSNGKKTFRNTELHRVRNGRIVETQVYFGWTVPHDARPGGFLEDDGKGHP
jgi:hypothetical protein